MFRIALHFILLLPALTFILCTTSHAEDHSGELSFPNWENAEGTIKIPIIKVKYTLSVFFGEPTETYFFYYEPIDDFTRINSIKMTAQVVAGGNITNAYINIDPLVDQPEKWGWDVPGSPDWGKMFHTKQGGFIDKERAKQFFKDGIALTNLEIVDMYASSGVDDAEYDAFGAQIPTSYVSNKSEVGQLDRSLPPTNFGGADFGDGVVQSSWASTNMWKKRLTGADFTNQLANVTKENVKSLNLKGMTHTTWKYNLYQHAAIELLLSEFAFKDKPTQEISIDIIWEDWSGGKRRQVQKHTFQKTLKPNQRMTAIDRVRRKQLDDGSLATYHVSYRILFLDTDEEEEAEDPLEELEEKRTYEAKLSQVKMLTKQAKADRDQYETAMKARREQAKVNRDAERARREDERHSQWVADQDAKNKANQQRLAEQEEYKAKKESEMDMQAATEAKAGQEAVELKRMEDEKARIERESYGELYAVVYQMANVKGGAFGGARYTYKGATKILTIRYKITPTSTTSEKYIPGVMLTDGQYGILQKWADRIQKYSNINKTGIEYVTRFSKDKAFQDYEVILGYSEITVPIPTPEILE